ncbi:MAG TPA: dihydroorotate dehydrogenase electron transfer subunit, partial [Candidatus Omnitrophica bacterium]|nr:dihydroorotate dehydrogenase electron transfer subunit [Candidatus Omnitrophota bacterium]
MTSKIYQKNATIIDNFRINGGYYKLILATPEIADRIIPGQFVHIRINDKTDPLLRRPFSVHRVIKNKGKFNKGQIEILYGIVGRGTEILSKVSPKKKLDILGPLGNGFKIGSEYSTHILIAGGMGVAPLMFLAERLSKAKAKNPKQKIVVLIGAQTKRKIFCEKEFKKLGCDIRISTDDGSNGFKGRVNSQLTQILPLFKNQASMIYACGPEA